MLGTYAAPKAAGAAEAVAESCGELLRWDRPSTGSTDLGCTINISKAALCVDITFGNSFAESPCSRFKLHWQRVGVKSKRLVGG